MNSRRTVIIVAALILAVLAFVGNVMYLQGVQERAYDNAKLVKVHVVKKEIPKGLTGDQAISQEYVGTSEIPQEFYPATAIKDIADIKSKVAVNIIPVGAVVLNGTFVPANQAQVTTAQQVSPGNVAITVSVDQVHGVAGLLMPGDKVNLIVMATDRGDNAKGTAQVLYQNVRILAIGAKTAPQAGDTSSQQNKNAAPDAGSGLITFEVPIEAAQRIALASTGAAGGSSLYLTLVPPNNDPVVGLSKITTDDLFNGIPLTPYDNQK